tara:strand:+ start:284 stop:412 length:129 start_codon:yes stop_codon:yes gene_type:complete
MARSAGVEPVKEVMIPVVVERVGQKVGQRVSESRGIFRVILM